MAIAEIRHIGIHHIHIHTHLHMLRRRQIGLVALHCNCVQLDAFRVLAYVLKNQFQHRDLGNLIRRNSVAYSQQANCVGQMDALVIHEAYPRMDHVLQMMLLNVQHLVGFVPMLVDAVLAATNLSIVMIAF